MIRMRPTASPFLASSDSPATSSRLPCSLLTFFAEPKRFFWQCQVISYITMWLNPTPPVKIRSNFPEIRAPNDFGAAHITAQIAASATGCKPPFAAPALPGRSAVRACRAVAPRLRGEGGFTFVELLVVTAIIGVLMALVTPAVKGVKSAGDVTSAAYTIKGVLEQARTFATANNTYVWVGFYEEDGSVPSTTPTATPGTGRLVMSVVASTDGTSLYGSNTGTIDPT